MAMDFLRLFPQQSPAATSPPPPLLFCAYRQLGLLCWDGADPNRLQLVSALASGNGNLDDDQPPSQTEQQQQQQSSQSVLFKRVSSIRLTPELPRTAAVDFTQLLVNRTGSLVALVGRRMLFCVQMDPDFWDRRHSATAAVLDLEFGRAAALDHLRAEYFCRCDLVHMGLFMRKYPPSVLKAQWFEPQSEARAHFDAAQVRASSGLLGLLFSDSVVRLYDLNSVVDRPLVQLDFNSLLPDRTPSESGDEFSSGGGGGYSSSGADSRPHSALGFVTQLVSFDFGPVHLVPSLPDSSASPEKYPTLLLFGSLLALDSNGQIYAGFFPFNSGSNDSGNSVPMMMPSPLPVGPLPCHFPPAQPPISTRLLCSALELLCVRHPNSQSICLWALASEDGLLVHLVLVQRSVTAEQMQQSTTADASNNLSLLINKLCPFELFTLECLEIDSSSTTNEQQQQKGQQLQRRRTATRDGGVAKALRLQNDSCADSCSYLAICARDLFRLELAPLLGQLVQKCSNDPTHQQQQQPQAQSVVQQLLMFADARNSGAAISSVAILEFAANGSSAADDQQQLLAALCTKSGASKTTASTQSQSAKSAPPSSQQQPQKQQQQPISRHYFLATLLSRRPWTSSSASQLLLPSTPQKAQPVPMPSSNQARQGQQQQLPSISDQVRHLLLADGNQRLPQSLPAIKFGEQQAEESGAGKREGDAMEMQKLVERAEHLSLVHNAVQGILLVQAMPARERAIECAMQRASALASGFQAVEQFRESSQHRLTTIFHQITDLKTQLLKRQRQLQQLEERIRRLALALQPLMFPAPEEEQAALETLRRMQQRLGDSFREIRKLDQRLRDHRQLLFGTAQPSTSRGDSSAAFSASSSNCGTGSGGGGGLIPAQMYLLSKNGRQCNKLRERMLQLKKQLEENGGAKQ